VPRQPVAAPFPARVTRLGVSRRMVRRGRVVTVSLRASGPLNVTLTIERAGRVMRTRQVRLAGAGRQRVRLGTESLRPGRYVVRAGAMHARVRVRR
jgi:hypothetical protein